MNFEKKKEIAIMEENFQKRFESAKKILAENGIVDCHFIRFKTLHAAVMSLKPDKGQNNLQVLHALCYDLVNIEVCNAKNLSMESQDYNLAYKMWNSHAVSILSKLYKENYGSDTIKNYLEMQNFYSTTEAMKAFTTDNPLQIFPKKQKKEIELPALLGFSELSVQKEDKMENIVQEITKPISAEEKLSDEKNVDEKVVPSPTADTPSLTNEAPSLTTEAPLATTDVPSPTTETDALSPTTDAPSPTTDASPTTATEPSKGNLIVIYIPLHWDKTSLKEFFASYGEITDTRIIRNQGGTSKGYGFVDFKDPQHSVKAMETLDGTNIDGKNLKIMIAGCGVKANLFVWNIPENWTELDLGKVFARFGVVTDKRILRKNGKTRYCGFVRFVTEESAKIAQKTLNQKRITHKGQTAFLQVQPAKKNIKKQKIDACRKKLPGMITNNHVAKLMFQQHQLTMQIMNKEKRYGARRDYSAGPDYATRSNYSARPDYATRPNYAVRPVTMNSRPSLSIPSPVSMYPPSSERQSFKHSIPMALYEKYKDKLALKLAGGSTHPRKYNTKQLNTDGPSNISRIGTKTLRDRYADYSL